MEHKRKKVFIEGAILPSFIADSLAKHATNLDIGAHSIFLGQIRNDTLENGKVHAMEYSAYIEMAEDILYLIREDAFAKFNLSCLHIYHSIGRVNVGEICLFVFTSSKHRLDAIEACSYLVERIKKEVPIWGKEIFQNQTYNWKSNG